MCHGGDQQFRQKLNEYRYPVDTVTKHAENGLKDGDLIALGDANEHYRAQKEEGINHYVMDGLVVRGDAR